MTRPLARTGFVWHERLMWHINGPAFGTYLVSGDLEPGNHVESAETKRKFKNLLDASGVTPQLHPIEFGEATDDDLLRFHTPDYIDRVQELSDARGGDAGEFAPVGPGSSEIARLGVGGTSAAIAAVARGDVDNAYALVRPPGHHAERDRGRGFCIFNNIAVGVMGAIDAGLVERVAVVDWDVHHGNGTQQAFFDRADVLTVSLHQEMLYPADLGRLDETGEGSGVGFNVNVPLPAGSGGGAYVAALDQVVVPALEAFEPDLLVVACGFDASYFDPMGHMLLLADHYRQFTRTILDLADRLCDGRVMMNHEGGYSDFYVPLCGVAVIEEMSGIASGVRDPYAATAAVPNQVLMPHQQEAVARAVAGPLAALLSRT
ncbi:MAG: class II histone deacetylase [Actinomycetota bacterium]